jgi:hypothetical protein
MISMQRMAYALCALLRFIAFGILAIIAVTDGGLALWQRFG